MGSAPGLVVERSIPAPPAAVFDAFVAMYTTDRPSRITASRLDLR
jgi:uncharacterized protein YndB with AHSA1/START domain